MITIADALQLEVFKGAKVVAGHKGVNRMIEWVHNSGVPDAARWVNGGELILTTIINMPAEIPQQEAYLHAIIKKDVAGLGITVGNYLQRTPDHLRKIADEYDFPLIEVPYEAMFVDIARQINGLIAQRNLKRALEIHQALTQLVVDGGGLHDLAETLAQLVRQSVSIENEQFEAYASVNIAEVDEARIYTQRYGRTDPRLVRALDERGYLPEIHRTLRPVNLPQMPDVGLEMERILAPIVVHGDVIGYMWIIADDRPLSELERMAIESGATVAALMLLRQEAVFREEASQRGDLLSSLMQADAINRAELLNDRALRYGVDLNQDYRVLLVDTTKKISPSVYRQVSRMLETLKKSIIAGRFAGHIVILVQNSVPLEPILEQLKTAFDDETTRIGISGIQHHVDGVSRAYAQAQETIHIMRRLKRHQHSVHFDTLGYLHALYKAGKSSLDGSPYIGCLRELVNEKQADLFHTLEVYLDTGGNGVATAEQLHIHRSTLNYRLARIEDICKVDLSDASVRMDLQVSLKLLCLFEID